MCKPIVKWEGNKSEQRIVLLLLIASVFSQAADGTSCVRFATLTLLACSVHGLAHSLCSLLRGRVEILEYVLTLLSRFTGRNEFLAVTTNTPIIAASAPIVLLEA